MTQPVYDVKLDPAHYGSLVARAKMLYAVYGITMDQYNQLLANQDYKCAICLAPHHPDRPLVVDHNHITGKVRGLLCSECNTGIGLLGDAPATLQSAMTYLEAEGSYSAASRVALAGTDVAPTVVQEHMDLAQDNPPPPAKKKKP